MSRFALLLIVLARLNAADPEPRWMQANRAAREALLAKDWAKLRAAIAEFAPMVPGNPRVAYNLAVAQAKLGNRDAALKALRDWAEMGLVADVAGDDNLATLRDAPQFAAAIARVAKSKEAVGLSTVAFPLPVRDMIPEDIAYDPATRRFFVSSVRKGIVITAEGREFARSQWPILALRVDGAHKLLWASTGYVPQGESVKEADKDQTALLAFDLATGEQKRRIESPLPGLLGDMTIARSGDLYVSEGIHGAVLHLAPGAGKFERLDEPGEFPSPQTPALSADEKTLYVPDYIRGIAAMRLDMHKVEWLQPAPGIALNGIDGLYVHGKWFVAVQNGTTPARIIRFPLDLKSQEVLEANTPRLGEPTHGTFVGDDFYFLANSGWNEYDAKGKRKGEGAQVESEVRKVRVD